MLDNNNFNEFSSNAYQVNRDETVQVVISKTFLFMFLALIISAVSAFWTVTSEFYVNIFTNDILFYGLLIGEVVLVIVAETTMKKNLVLPSALLFIAYSVVNGMTLSSILLVYTMESIFSIFLIAAIIFGVMAVFGFVTKRDLNALGTIGMMGLLGVIIVSIVNIFILKSNGLSILLSAVGLAIFIGLTAYDLQKIKEMARNNVATSNNVLALYGALILYLDFINIFLKLLRLFGKRNN